MPSRPLRYLIFASPKSGTTWLQRLLSAHPDVHCGETRLFGQHIDPSRPSGLGITLESYVANLQRHLNAPTVAQKTEPTLSDLPAKHTPFAQELLFDLTDQIARTTMRVSGKSIYGEKLTPYLGTAAPVLRQLHAYDPDTRLIFLVRDGRDVVVSGASQWNNLTRSGTESGTMRAIEPRATPINEGVDEPYFDMFLRHWSESAAAFGELRGLFAHRLVVRYEDMLSGPVEQAARVLGFIGARDDSGVVEACVHAASFERLSGGRSRGEENTNSFFRKGIAGDWRTKLSARQVERFAQVAGSWLREYGYESSTPSVEAKPKPMSIEVPAVNTP